MLKLLIYVWHGCGILLESFYSHNHSIVASFPHFLTHEMSANSPQLVWYDQLLRPQKSERARKTSYNETAPMCHRVTRQAGHQKGTSELSLQNSQLLSHLRLSNGYPSANISPGRGWCGESGSYIMMLQVLAWAVHCTKTCVHDSLWMELVCTRYVRTDMHVKGS